MKALRIRQYGGSEVLEIVADAPQPVPGKGQVLVRVQAASINPIDWKVRQGYLKDHVPLTMPATLGGDFVGVVANAGDSGFTVGERIYGYASLLAGGSGSFAEYAAAETANAARAPEKATPHEAGALAAALAVWPSSSRRPSAPTWPRRQPETIWPMPVRWAPTR